MKKYTDKNKWKETLRGGFTAVPVFWQHFLLLAVVLALALGVQLISNSGYDKIITDSYLRQAEGSFHGHCEEFSAMLQEAYIVPAVVESSEAYKNLQRIEGGQLPKTSKVFVLNGLREQLQQTLSLVGVADEEEYFLYMPDYDAVIAGGGIFPESRDCFDRHLRMGDLSAEQVIGWIGESGFVRLSAEMPVSIDGQEKPCLVLLNRQPSTNTVLGFVYASDSVLEMFNIPDLPEETYFRIVDETGTTILRHGQPLDGRSYDFIAPVQSIGGQATLSIPASYFSDVTRPTRVYGVLLLGLTLLLGLALCWVFSGLGTRPLRKLLASYGAESSDVSRNEIHRLADILAFRQLESESVNQILGTSVLARVLSGGVLTKKEEQMLLENYPMLEDFCRIAIVHTTAAVDEFGQAEITELVAEHLPETFACSTVSGLETGVLLPDDPDALTELARVLAGVNNQLNMDGLSVLCGVSAPFSGVHSAYAAVRQARFSIPIRESSYIEVYSAEEATEDRPGVFSWLTHERLYQAVMKNDRADTVEFIRQLAADKYYSAADAKEVFYNVRFVVRSTANEMQLPLPEADILEYREEMRPKENFRILEELACTLFDRLHARQETNTNKTLENVVAYVSENFRNPELSANMVATHFALPVKTIYGAVRDKTGKSMGDFLIDLRMKEAAKLLCTTPKSIDEIAVECGYPAQSTFYRVFKNYYGESPSRYRSLH